MADGFNDLGAGGDLGGQPSQPPRKKSSAGKIILILGGIGGVLLLVCCGGFALLGMFGLNVVGDVVKKDIQNVPEIQEHIGEISKCSFNIMATSNLAEETGEQGVMVFDLSGSKGSGTLTARVVGESVTDATLELPTGEKIELSQ